MSEKVKPTLRYDEGDECWVLSAPPGMRLRKIVGDWEIDEKRTLICFEVAAPEASE